MSDQGWIGCDLDGTLALYDGWRDGSIGPPIPKMVNRVKQWLNDGKNVKIMTARVSSADTVRFPEQAAKQQKFIQDWCLEHLGQVLPITAEKDFHMYELWDDRAIQVIPNTGATLEDKIDFLEEELEYFKSLNQADGFYQ